jgi:hypothetical protein
MEKGRLKPPKTPMYSTCWADAGMIKPTKNRYGKSRFKVGVLGSCSGSISQFFQLDQRQI